MNKKIVIVGFDVELIKEVSKLLAQLLNVQSVDLDEQVNIKLMKCLEVELQQAGTIMNNIEKDIIRKAISSNCIISVSTEMFMSNNNFKLFKDYIKVHVKLSANNLRLKSTPQTENKINQQIVLFDEINDMLEKLVTVTLNSDNKTVIDISKEIEKLINIKNN